MNSLKTKLLKIKHSDPQTQVMNFIFAIIGVGIALIIFGSFVGIVSTSISSANLSSSEQAIADITVIVYIVGVVLAVLGAFFLLGSRRSGR